MAGLKGLPAMAECYFLGASWPQCGGPRTSLAPIMLDAVVIITKMLVLSLFVNVTIKSIDRVSVCDQFSSQLLNSPFTFPSLLIACKM